MKINIEIIENLDEDEVTIRCKKVTKSIQQIHEAIIKNSSSVPKLVFYKKNEEYYFQLQNVYFFETSDDCVYAHTADDTYRIKYRLYELSEMLPHDFIRASKSTIVNIRHILAIDRNLTSSSLIKFHKSHKQVYVSRLYYKELRHRLNERSNNYEN